MQTEIKKYRVQIKMVLIHLHIIFRFDLVLIVWVFSMSNFDTIFKLLLQN